MPGIHPNVAYHKLAIDPNVKLMQQKKRCHGLKQLAIIMAKVEKLLKVRFIEEVPHTTPLANVVMVKKTDLV